MRTKIVIIGIVFCFCMNGKNTALTLQDQLKSAEQTIPLPYHAQLNTNDSIPNCSDYFVTYEKLFEQELISHKLPIELKYLPIALTAAEPNFNHNDRCGMWALPVLVALKYGLVVTATHDERFDVQLETRAALEYLSDLYTIYGDWWLALLAYTNSPSALNSVILSEKNDLQLWDFYDRQLLKNVSFICNFIRCNLNPSSLSHNNKHTRSYSNSFVELKRPILRSLLYRKIDIKNSIFEQLNPIFKGNIIIPLKQHKLYLPNENAALFRTFEDTLYTETFELLHKNIEQKAMPKKIYVVRSGDSLGKIAQQLGVSITALKQWNNLKNDNIYIGQKLILEQTTKLTKTINTSQVSTNKTLYQVRKGDSLGAIAQKYKVRVSDIKRWNNLRSDFIRENQRLIIYKK